MATHLFVPGFGAPSSLYRPALGDGWLVHEPPRFLSQSDFDGHVEALRRRLRELGPVTVAGHSLGAATAIAVAAHSPELVSSLLLIAPAGLPLSKPIRDSLAELGRQTLAGLYPSRDLGRAILEVLRAPGSALRLAREVQALDLEPELDELRRRGVACEVIGCAGDTLTPLAHCRRIAELAGAPFRQVSARGGHMGPVTDPALFAPLLALR